jgi:hypothetical protein
VDPECLEELCRVVPLLISAAAGVKQETKAGKRDAAEDEEEDEEESLQTELFAVCMDLLAVPGDHSVKGIRDAIKRAWGSIMQHCVPDSDVAEAILLAVIGNDVQEDADVEELEEGVQGVNMGEEEDDEESDGDEEEEEDVMLGHDDMMSMLNTEGMDGLSDDEGEIAHHEGADAALAQLIQMKKQNRKKGLLLAKRQELIIRSRAIDILEVFLHRNENALLVLPMFRPLLFCLKKVTASSLSKSLQEGRAFQQRLRSLIEAKVGEAHAYYCMSSRYLTRVCLTAEQDKIGVRATPRQ